MPRKKQKGPKPGTLFKDVNRTAVGMNITAIRRRRGITQQQLADKTGLDKTTISYYERKAIAIPLDKLQMIAHVLQVSADALINGKASPIDLQVGKPLLKRFEKAKTLPQEKQDKLMDFADRVMQFLDSAPWCDDPWNTPVYLSITLRLEDMSSGAEERYKGTIIVSNSYDIQFSDLRWRFAYQSGDQILYEENNFDSFTSVLAFYVNMILGGEFDKWGIL